MFRKNQAETLKFLKNSLNRIGNDGLEQN